MRSVTDPLDAALSRATNTSVIWSMRAWIVMEPPGGWKSVSAQPRSPRNVPTGNNTSSCSPSRMRTRAAIAATGTAPSPGPVASATAHASWKQSFSPAATPSLSRYSVGTSLSERPVARTNLSRQFCLSRVCPPLSVLPPSRRGSRSKTSSGRTRKHTCVLQTIVLIPIGAASKEHGPHLKLKNDWLSA